MSFPYHVRGRARKELGRKWGLASAKAREKLRMERGVDWLTTCKRAADDMRGAVEREGVTCRAGRTTAWQIRRSLRGRLNQVDFVLDGQLWRTGSRRAAAQAVRQGKWRAGSALQNQANQ